MLGLPDEVHACLFDLDGVLTDTARVHTRAWRSMFDGYLERRAQRAHSAFVPFDPVNDYRTYIDGKKRQDGVRSFLASRNIDLPEGDFDDPSTAETINGLGNRKNALFQQILQKQGVEVFDGSRRYLEAVHAAGIPAAVVSSSANTEQILEITGLDRFVQQRVDGGSRSATRTCAASPHPTRSCAERNYSTSNPHTRRCSRCPRRGWRRAGPGSSVSSSASIGWARLMPCGTTAPTSSSPISPNYWIRSDQR